MKLSFQFRRAKKDSDNSSINVLREQVNYISGFSNTTSNSICRCAIANTLKTNSKYSGIKQDAAGIV